MNDSVYRNSSEWLPTSAKEVEALGWDYIDVIIFSGDAYVDHPSFGAAVIGRTLQAHGLRVAIVPQPNWRDDCVTSKSWVVHGFSSECRPARWTRW